MPTIITTGAMTARAFGFGHGGARSFSISPSVSGHSVWDLDLLGPLVLGAGTWTIVPNSIFIMHGVLVGGGGAANAFNNGPPIYQSSAGTGGTTTADVLMISGQSYTLIGAATCANTLTGGYPGGGSVGLSGRFTGGAGGGYSIIQFTGGAPVLIAAGGGGSGFYSGTGVAVHGYGGGGLVGNGPGNEINGAGGTQMAGGSIGGGSLSGGSSTDQGGGGGGGYYGGGAGYVSGNCGGGGGGSSFADGTYCSNIVYASGLNDQVLPTLGVAGSLTLS